MWAISFRHFKKCTVKMPIGKKESVCGEWRWIRNGTVTRGWKRVKPFEQNPVKIEKIFHQLYFPQGYTKIKTEERWLRHYIGKGLLSYDLGEHKTASWVKKFKKKIYPFPKYNQTDLDFFLENQNIWLSEELVLSSLPHFFLYGP